MKYRIITLVFVLLAVLLASCDINQPHEIEDKPKSQPEKQLTTVKVLDTDSVRIPIAKIEFDTPNSDRYRHKVMSSSGIFQDSLLKERVALNIYAYADGYELADTVRADLNNDINEIIILEKEDDTQPVDSVDVRIEVLDFDTDQRINSAEILEVTTVDTTTLSTNGIYAETRAKKDIDISILARADGYQDMSQPRVINTDTNVSIEIRMKPVENPQGPGQINVTGNSCSDMKQSNGSITLYIENGAEKLTIAHDDQIVHERFDISAGEEVELAGLTVGDHKITAVKNNQQTQVTETIITCDQPQPPKARFTSDVNGFTVQYDASTSSTENGEINEYAWDWTNDGTVNKVTTSPTVSHTFDQEGPFTTRLRVTDAEDLTDETTGEVNPFQPNRAPDVKFDVEVEGRTGIFNNRSTDPDGDNLSCTWDYGNGDTANVFEQDYTWSEYGVFEVVLTCEDPYGASDSNSETVTLEDPQGPGNITLGTISCSESGEEVGSITGTVENGFESIRLKTAAGEIVRQRSNLTPQSNQSFSFSSLSAGDYNVIATKNEKLNKERNITVDVCPIATEDPEADFSWKTDGLTVDFDGSKSSDPDGNITSYQWKFGDGGAGAGIAPNYTYQSAGDYSVTLTVTDNDGLVDSVTYKVAVDQPLSDEIFHEINYALNGDRHAVSPTNQADELIAYGELRPILTDENPVGTVRLEVKHFTSSESNQDFSLQFNCGEVNRTFSSATVEDPTGTGWVMSELELDADNLKSKEFCTIEARSEGSGEVVFSDADNAGKMIFTWRTLVNGKWKTSTSELEFKTNIN